MGQRPELSKTIQLSSNAVISNENSLEDIKKLFDDINQKIESVITSGSHKKNRPLIISYSKPKFNIINHKELEIIVELVSKNEPFPFDYNDGVIGKLLFTPIKFSNQIDLDQNYDNVKRDNIVKLKGKNGLKLIQGNPPIFKAIGEISVPFDLFLTPQTETINLSELFTYRPISALEENTLIYNIGIGLMKPDLKNESWKNVVNQYKRNNKVAENVNPSKTAPKNDSIQTKTASTRTKYEAILSHLNPSEILYIQKIKTMYPDPNHKLNSVCGKAISKCKVCGRNYGYDKKFQSTISLVQGFLEMFDLQSENDDVLELAKDLRIYINQIKSGNYYYCEGEASGFCSKKCLFSDK